MGPPFLEPQAVSHKYHGDGDISHYLIHFFPHLCLIMSYWEVGTMSLKPDHNLFLGNTLRPSLTALTYGNRGVTWAKRASILNSHSKLAGKDEGDTTKMNVICAQNKYFKCQEIKFQIEIFH